MSDGCGATGTATVTFTATDECGNASTTSATFTIQDTTVPTITAQAANQTIECNSADTTSALNAWLASNGGATATDACSNVTWTNNFTALSDGCGATGTATVTFTATDECGNASTTSATFTIQDTTVPVISTPATNLSVECNSSDITTDLLAWLANHGGAIASDACSNITWTNNFSGLSDGCGVTGSATVTFTATDECNNQSMTTATFTIQDTTAPVITTSATNLTIECDSTDTNSALVAWLASHGNADATDSCSNVTWTNDFVGLSNGCGLTGSALVIFTATDECGNASTTSATFTIQDTTVPTITVQASNQTIECSSTDTTSALNAWLASNGGATATDTCSNVTWTNNFTSLSDGCGVTGNATVIFTATDECGNVSTTSATFTIQDTTAPTLVSTIDSPLNVNCDVIPAVPTLVFADGCSSASEITQTISETISEVAPDGTYTIVRTWDIADACGNPNSFTQTINVTIPNYLQTTTIDAVCDIDDDLTVDVTAIINTQFPGIISTNGTFTDVDGSGALTTDGIFTPLNLVNGNYIIRYENNDPNCPRIVEVTIPVDRNVCTVENCVTLTVYNAITPGNDDKNEFFFIDEITNPCYADNTVEIYNRWGVKVFETRNYNNIDHVFTGVSEGRDTVKQSAELPNGTYFYILKYKNIEGNYESKNGYLYLTR